ncbi:MAG: hypothetical protein H6883_03780 [Rhodobiaceae bacterium]|nr:hypothetical protein [Rhodobiaceae bacterium]MCC0055237.1 hypothetical protein [Rhodobiaceae bacterium]
MTIHSSGKDFSAVHGRLTDWTPQASRDWGRAPIRLQHRLAETGLFTDEALAEIIDRYPVESYSLISMGAFGSERRWRIGRVDGLSGREIIDAIRENQLWLNLRSIDQVDPRFASLFATFLKELGEDVGGLDAFPGKMGVLISGPRTKVDYHADLPGQSLWQIRGEKTVYVYPPEAPYISDEQLQDITYDGVEKLDYEKAFDEGAAVLPLKPGEMLHWQLNAPHRVENGDMMNVSVTTEYLTTPIKRLNHMNLANAILRHRFGITSRTRPTSGPVYFGKALLQAGFAKAGLLERRVARSHAQSFVLGRNARGGFAMTDI